MRILKQVRQVRDEFLFDFIGIGREHLLSDHLGEIVQQLLLLACPALGAVTCRLQGVRKLCCSRSAASR